MILSGLRTVIELIQSLNIGANFRGADRDIVGFIQRNIDSLRLAVGLKLIEQW